MTSTSKVGIAVLAATLTAGGLVPARAQGASPGDSEDLVQMTVSLGDLDLASRSGQAKARQRLAVAVHTACGDADMDNAAATATCQDDALGDARTQLTKLIGQARAPGIQLAAR